MAKFYVVCDDDCRYEGMTREQILTAIQQAVEKGYVSDPDSAVFSKVKELRTGTSTSLWIGTEAQFNGLNIAPTVAKTVVRVGTDGVLYLCTDDTSIPDIMPVEAGGTGANTVEGARSSLGLPNPTTADSGKVVGVDNFGGFALTDPAADFIVDQGVIEASYTGEQAAAAIGDTWMYRKWNSGLAECWTKLTRQSAINKSWGSLYETLPFPAAVYPIAFAEMPLEFATGGNNATGGWVEVSGTAQQTLTNTKTYQYIRPAKSDAVETLTINLHVIGRWK